MSDDNKQKNDGLASFSTRPSRSSSLPSMPAISRPKMPQKHFGWVFRFLALLIIVLLVGFGGGWLGAYAHDHGDSISTSKDAQVKYVSNESQLISDIAKNVGPSVVSVNDTQQSSVPDFFGFSQTQSAQAAGTGVILTSDGLIMTNRHVVPSGTTDISVTLEDGTQYDNVQVIGRTSDSDPIDVAFLKINNLNGKKLTPVNLGDSSKVEVGDKVVAIGNALGQFQNTVTSGIISGYGRDVTAGDSSGAQSSENLTDLFQTDAAINEGNSGGPLVDINGDVIGLNTATAANAQNIGFAIPINDLKGLINSAMKSGSLQQAYLGVRYVSITADVAKQYNLSVKQGAYIIDDGSGNPAVVSDSPAAKAGLKSGDIITKVNNVSVDNKTSLTGALVQFQPGDSVNLTVIRGGKTINVKATLGTAPTN